MYMDARVPQWSSCHVNVMWDELHHILILILENVVRAELGVSHFSLILETGIKRTLKGSFCLALYGTLK